MGLCCDHRSIYSYRLASSCTLCTTALINNRKRNKMKKPTTMMLILLLNASIASAACGPPTYSGCTSAQLRQIQSGQYKARSTNNLKQTQDYWRDRQYNDKKDTQDRNERRDTRELEAQTRRYEAKQYKEANRRRKADVIIYNGPRQLSYWEQKRLEETGSPVYRPPTTNKSTTTKKSTRGRISRSK